MFKIVHHVFFAVAFTIIAAASASAQDFQRSYPLPAGGRISLANVSGSIKVTGYDGNAVLVTATKVGRDANLVTIEDRSSANSVDLRTEYPRNCNCEASVEYEVMVPRSTAYVFDGIASVSGNVTISDVTGRLDVNSVSGNVDVKDVTGTVDANSVSGDVLVAISQLMGSDSLKFNSVSGDVVLRVPSDIDANVDFTTLSGEIESDFQLEMRQKKYGPGRSARGQLGGGSRTVSANSVSGSIRLLRY